MVLSWNDRFGQVFEKKRLKIKYERDLQTVERVLREQTPRLNELAAIFDKEKADVDRLEEASIVSLFHQILGNREQMLEKERQEYLAAKLAYEQIQHHVRFLQDERSRLIEELDPLKSLDAEMAALLAEKEEMIRQSNPALDKELADLLEQIANLRADEKEINEAIAAANRVITCLQQIIQSLESAADWGTWDLLGGGTLSTLAKHSHIDAARSSVHEAEAYLGQFKRELADVRASIDLSINIDEFTSFADYFFDGLITDWIVQSKITDSLDRTRQAKQKVEAVYDQLNRLLQTTRRQAEEISARRTRRIEGA